MADADPLPIFPRIVLADPSVDTSSDPNVLLELYRIFGIRDTYPLISLSGLVPITSFGAMWC